MSGKNIEQRAVVGVVYKNDKILLIKRKEHPKGWSFSGGGIKDGETQREALVREIKEETQIDIFPLRRVGYRMIEHPIYLKVNTKLDYWECLYLSGRVRLNKRELDGYMWARPYEVIRKTDKKLYSPVRELLIRKHIQNLIG